MTPKRTRPLSAPDPGGISADDVFTDDDLAPDARPEALDHSLRDERFADGIATLRIGSAGGLFSERLLLVLAGIVAPLGIIVVVLGWWGASQTPYAFEQVPYLISGGLLGLALVFVGSFFYFAHWLTQLVKEHRDQSQAILAALERIADQQEEAAAATNGRRTRRAS